MALRYDALGKSLRSPDPRSVRYRGRASTTRLLLASLSMCVLSAPTSVLAQAVDDWVGNRVVQKSEKLDFFSIFESDLPFEALLPFAIDMPSAPGNARVDAKLTKSTLVPTIYRSDRRHGPWLWISNADQSVHGWVSLDQVVSVDNAIEFFTNQIRASPKDAFTFAMRGMVRDDKSDHDAAVSDFGEAVKLDPTSVFAYMGRARAWRGKNNFQKTIADFTQAIKLDPQCGSCFLVRGGAWSELKEHDKAIADYNEAIRIDARQATAFQAQHRNGSRRTNSTKQSATAPRPFGSSRPEIGSGRCAESRGS